MHEISLALSADEMIILDRGRVLHQGACTHAATHCALEQVFDQRIAVEALGSYWMAVPKIG